MPGYANSLQNKEEILNLGLKWLLNPLLQL